MTGLRKFPTLPIFLINSLDPVQGSDIPVFACVTGYRLEIKKVLRSQLFM